MSIRVIGNRVLVRNVEPYEAPSDVLDVVGMKSLVTGEVASVGGDVVGIKPGQRVVFGPYAGRQLEEYQLLYQGDVVGLLADS